MSVEITIKLSLAEVAAIQNAGANYPSRDILESSGKVVVEPVTALPYDISHRLPNSNLNATRPRPAAEAPGFHVFVQDSTGKRIRIQMHNGATIDHVKTLIYDSGGPPPDQQRLLYAGSQLEDGRQVVEELTVAPEDDDDEGKEMCTFGDYEIPEGSTIYLVPRLRGS